MSAGLPPALLLPAVVLGIDTPIGLSIVRELGERGVAVHGIARSSGALGLSSRYLARGLLRAQGEPAVLAQLLAVPRDIGPACLFAIAESDIAFLNRHRAALAAAGYRPMFADQARMERVLNKEQSYRAAAAAGLRVPRTEQVASIDEAQQVGATLRYPVVLKWANPNAVAALLAQAGLALDKTRYCDTPQQLLDYLRPYAAVGCYPLIQEYCAGYGLGQFVLMHQGRAHDLFQHRRRHEWPPEGGFSSQCESLPLSQHAALMAQSVALLQALGWEGVAMVEYRYDPATGAAALMEINGRFWGSLPLAWHAGAAFAWHSHQLLGMGLPVRQSPYRAGLRCRFMVPETKRLLRILFQPDRIADRTLRFRRLPELAGYLADFVRPGNCYYVHAWRDPLPFWRDLWQMARHLGSGVGARVRARLGGHPRADA